MNISISPSTVEGSLTAPPSKSMMQRACAAALLCSGETVICHYGQSDDDKAALRLISDLGATLTYDSVEEVRIRSDFPSLRPRSRHLHCGESGLSMRLFTCIAALFPEEMTLTGTGSLRNRPMNFFEETLPQLGVLVRSRQGKPPLQIKGPLQPADIIINGAISSQYLTGLLFAYAAAAADKVSITVKNPVSKPYTDLTLETLEAFGMPVPENTGYETFYFNAGNRRHHAPPRPYLITGDWSSASFLLVAGAIAGSVTVKGLDAFSAQADKKILQALADCGCSLSIYPDQVTATAASLKAFHFDATDSPDLFPPLVALAAYCTGTSVIEGVHRLLHKESNRAATLQEVFGALGVHVTVQDDKMLVKGGKIRGGKIHSHQDHRIAMAGAIAALGAGSPVEIIHAEATAKSYPGFYSDLQKAGISCQVTQK